MRLIERGVFMGQVIIEVPQKINRTFRVNDVELVNEILRMIEKPQRQTIKPNLPDDLSNVNEDDVLGIWADREESAEEIARRIRDLNNGKTR